jgi:hypothetical protein
MVSHGDGITARPLSWIGSLGLGWVLGNQPRSREQHPCPAACHRIRPRERRPGYNGTGFLEPLAWRNVRDVHVGFEWPELPKWRLAAEVHRYWRATTRDGVYVDEGQPRALPGSWRILASSMHTAALSPLLYESEAPPTRSIK